MFAENTKILVVDDMSTYRKLVKKSLAELGLKNVTEAIDGEAAWTEIANAVAANTPFQLIISDWNMPKVKGINLLNRVRSNTVMKAVPFVMLTAETEKDVIVEAIQAGVTSYIVKPFTLPALKEKLDAITAAKDQKKAG